LPVHKTTAIYTTPQNPLFTAKQGVFYGIITTMPLNSVSVLNADRVCPAALFTGTSTVAPYLLPITPHTPQNPLFTAKQGVFYGIITTMPLNSVSV